jgi:hypothetical protein
LSNETATAPAPELRARSGSELRRYRPLLSIGHHQSLLALVRDLEQASAGNRVRKLRSAIDAAEARRTQLLQMGAALHDLQRTVAYIAALRVLRDLVLQGWTPGLDEDGSFMLPPDFSEVRDDASEVKTEIRNSFKFAIADQLLSPAVSSFIQKMERRGIGALFADGPDLANRIRRHGPEAVTPRLELVSSPTDRDSETGIRLQDIWRYARLQWSIPYQTTPGRNLHYIVRDGGAPGRPVIGIAALGNAILGLNQRDDALGWSVRSISKRYLGASSVERDALALHLVTVLDEEQGRIFKSDLKIPSDPVAAVRYLAEVEADADSTRKSDLTASGNDRTDEYTLTRDAHSLVEQGRASEVDWEAVAQTSLYRKKRAANLTETTRALAEFENFGIRQNPASFAQMLDNDRGQRAIEMALRRIKQRAIAENVMEIITCGAVAPYQQLLGGKLVAMLMTSPQVVRDFSARYEGKVSLIASGMSGRPVVRKPVLAALTTSSLYSVGSAQYNRVKIPGEIVGRREAIKYTRVGATDSFGTVQFASDTTRSLGELTRLANENRRVVNNLFGEGMSPKLRSLRMGLEALGLPPDEYLRHHSPRLLYAIALASNTDDVLLGLPAEPDYVLPIDGGEETTSAIAGYWAKRWMKARVERESLLDKIELTRSSDALLSHVSSDLRSFIGKDPEPIVELVEVPTNSDGPISFVEKLYRNANSYADRLTVDELNSIHVDFGVDDFVRNAVAESRQLVVTGNPGDGKTFLIQRMQEELETSGAVVITDANALSYQEVLSSWRSCEENKRPFVLAINEWPLFELQALAQKQEFFPVSEAVRQVREAIYYGTPPAPPVGRVMVMDLNLRDVLAPIVTRAIVDRLTDEQFTGHIDPTDPASSNVARLKNERVQERLAALLVQVARRGEHTTMRQLVGFAAYLVTGGTDSSGRILTQSDGSCLYANLAFEGGTGPLFDSVRRAFDPARITHPDIDELLWRGTTDSSDWIDLNDVPVAAASCPLETRTSVFRLAKRRFYFEHVRGSELLGALPRDELEFDEVLTEGTVGSAEVVRNVVHAINRFFEPDSTREEDRRLRLWQSHRFDAQPPSAFVALHNAPTDAMHAQGPEVATWVHAWLPKDLLRPNQFALVNERANEPDTRLLIDREVFLTLNEAALGLGQSTWSRSISRKVTRFVDELHRQLENQEAIADLEMRNVDTNQVVNVQVHRSPPRYKL